LGVSAVGVAPSGVRALQRVARAFAFQNDGVLLLAIEVAENGVGELAIDFDVPFPADGVAGVAGGAHAAEHADEQICNEVRQDFFLAEVVDAAGGNQVGPVLEPGGINGRPRKPRQVRPQHVGPKERFGFNRHD
jgi:hypothetical protein